MCARVRLSLPLLPQETFACLLALLSAESRAHRLPWKRLETISRGQCWHLMRSFLSAGATAWRWRVRWVLLSASTVNLCSHCHWRPQQPSQRKLKARTTEILLPLCRRAWLPLRTQVAASVTRTPWTAATSMGWLLSLRVYATSSTDLTGRLACSCSVVRRQHWGCTSAAAAES